MVREALAGDRDGFRALYDTHKDEVFRFLLRLSRNRHDAEDLLQETFARLWKKRSQYRGDGSLAGYIRKIAYRTFLNARPRLSAHKGAASLEVVGAQEAVDSHATPAEKASERDLRQYLLREVKKAVDELPDSWREPFILFRYEGLKLREIADVLEITPKAVEIRVTRALKRVAAQLAEVRARHGGRHE